MHLKKISRELRRQLFGRNRRRRSRSRSCSPQRHHNYDECPHGDVNGYGRRGDHADHSQNDRGRRPRSRSPGRRGGQSRSPGGKRCRSPVREGSTERRAKIELWNREKEQAECGNENANNVNNNDSSSDVNAQNEEQYYDGPHQ